MRGDGDSPMGKGNDEENIGTLKDVIKGQRKSYRRFMDGILLRFLNFGPSLLKFSVIMMLA